MGGKHDDSHELERSLHLVRSMEIIENRASLRAYAVKAYIRWKSPEDWQQDAAFRHLAVLGVGLIPGTGCLMSRRPMGLEPLIGRWFEI